MTDRRAEPPIQWLGLSEWWLDELEHDPTYEDTVTPIMEDLTRPRKDQRLLDIGCGDGRLMRAFAQSGALVIGVDIDLRLLRRAHESGPSVRVALPRLDPIVTDTFDGAFVCLVLEHIEDHAALFTELARVVRAGGRLALLVNHPIFTAPGSAPIVDEEGETLWRPGAYFGSGFTDEPAGVRMVRFHHRTIGELLSSAAAAGWCLESVIEVGVTGQQILRAPWLEDQRHIPRLMAARWINGSGR